MTDRAELIDKMRLVRDVLSAQETNLGDRLAFDVEQAIAALKADMAQEPTAPGIYDVQSKAQREWWEVRNGLMTMVRFRSLKEIMAGLGIEQFKPFGDYPDYTAAPTSPTGTAETAADETLPLADVEAWLDDNSDRPSDYTKVWWVEADKVRDFIAARDKQHAEEVELLQSKLALVLRENRRLSDELKKADEAVAEKDARISATLKERDHYAIELTNALERESQIRADERAKVLREVPMFALERAITAHYFIHGGHDATERAKLTTLLESARAAQEQK